MEQSLFFQNINDTNLSFAKLAERQTRPKLIKLYKGDMGISVAPNETQNGFNDCEGSVDSEHIHLLHHNGSVS